MTIWSESRPHTRDSTNVMTLDNRGGNYYIVRKGLYHQPDLPVVKSQRTNASLDVPAPRLVNKFMLPPAAQTPEEKLLSNARASRFAIDTGGDSHWGPQRLPRILQSEDLPITTQPYAAEILRDASCKTHDEHCPSDENRPLRIVTMEELLPIGTLSDASDYAQVFFDVLNGHKWLYNKTRILHRDISVANIMYRRDHDGAVYGVLNDMDLSSDLKDLEDLKATSMRRTGTPPFMAIDLLRKHSVQPDHIYRHDLESFFYVMLILFARYEFLAAEPTSIPIVDRGERLVKQPNAPLREWFDPALSWETLAVEKSDFFMSPRLDDDPFETENIMSSSFADFTDWISDLRAALKEGIHAHGNALDRAKRDKRAGKAPSKKPFTSATLGGKFQYSTFFDVMKNFGDIALRAPPYSLDTDSTM